jgi:hypothetical protein
LDCDQLFADYFEPNTTYAIRLARDFPERSLMRDSSEKVEELGIDLSNGRLLMSVAAGPFDMEEFVVKVVEPGARPTLLLLEWGPGSVVGGFAAVAWPKVEKKPEDALWVGAVDQQMESFIFSLAPSPRSFALLKAGEALYRVRNAAGRWFQFGNDLGICAAGWCSAISNSVSVYARGRDGSSFPGDDVPFLRLELWVL